MKQETPLNTSASNELPLPESHFRKLGIASRTTFYRWEAKGLPILHVGRRRFIRPSDLDAFLEIQSALATGTVSRNPQNGRATREGLQ